MSTAVTAGPATGPSVYRVFRIALSLSPLILTHVGAVAALWMWPTITSLILLLVVTRIAGLGTTVGFHRYFAHRSFKTSRWFQFVLGVAGCTALQKGPLWWVIHHREHHRHSDAPGDPHSPVVESFWYGHMGWLFANDLMHPDHGGVRDLTRYPEIVWLDRLWMVPGALLAAACFAIDGWEGLLWGYCMSVALVFQVTFAVNSIGHTFGPQRFDTGDGSRNNWLVGILAMGDGWHNNHHKAPFSARHGFAWYEFDQSYMVIKLLKRIGLTWDIKQPPAELLRAPRRREMAGTAVG